MDVNAVVDLVATAWNTDEERLVHRYVCLSLAAFGLVSAFLLQFITAPYGRYARKGWGLMVPAKLGWVLQECPTLIWSFSLLFAGEETSPAASHLPNVAVLGLFIFHYINRTLVYPFRLRGGAPATLTTTVLAMLFCTINGYIQARQWTRFADDSLSFTTPHFLIGAALFFIGWGINYQSDDILRNLRRPGEKGYKIPRGGMFEYVSGANFFGECVEWVGFAVAGWSLPGLCFAVATVCNIGPRAYHHHQWYLQKFKSEYPTSRKALIPFVL